jgi:dipeptidyl aminopeptidase/acylaminoacyl peptidase
MKLHPAAVFSATILVASGSLIALAQAPATPAAPRANVTLADYTRALGLQAKYTGQSLNVADPAVWLPSGKFWYRKTVKGGRSFVLVDPAGPTQKPAFDHQRLAVALSTALARPFTAVTLPFTTFTLSADEQSLTFTDANTAWTCSLSAYSCAKSTSPPAPAGPGRGQGAGAGGVGAGGGQGRGGRAGGPPGSSTEGAFIASIKDNNVCVRPAAFAADACEVLTRRGTADKPYTLNGLLWSPDSKKIFASRLVKNGDRRMVRYVDSSPADQVQPKTFERFYAKPGDALDETERVLVDAAGKREILVENTLFPTPYEVTRIQWRRDSRAVTFEYNQLGHHLYRVIEVAGDTGIARTLIDEPTDTFIHYARVTGELSTGGRTYRYDLDDGREIIWMSERDGRAHLYLIDGATGRIKNQITKGNWMVRGVVGVDEAARQVTIMTAGVSPKQDPYFVQYYRVNLDGTGMTPLTSADGYHSAVFSPDNKYFVDTWSRVDLAPVSVLRRVSDGQQVLELERGDLTPLAATGWRAPEAFVAKGRDQTTDIYGIIIRPTRFDPARKYPVIENIYAGPHGSFVPKTFSEYYGMQALADLGFVVVQIDGMGTANRSKAFHDVSSKNLKDAGFPDRILWHKAAAKKHPWYDVSRVGIYGGSAGGQNALGGMLFHPEFYKVAVAFAGCHDNRMDKIWWNEQWMSWPIGPQYADSSNVVHAGKLQGKLLLVVGELDTNVDPSSTMQVVNALIKANKYFDLLVMPGEDHPAGRRGPSAPYGDKKLWDFFVSNLLGSSTPDWNQIPAAKSMTTPAASLFGESWEQILAHWDVERQP